MCTIFNPKGQVIAMILHSDGLYRIIGKHDKDGGVAAVASGKMLISKAHRKLGHLAYGAVTHAISKGYIAGIGIDLDTNSKLEFCDAKQKRRDNHSQRKVKPGLQNMASMYTGTCGVQQP